MKIGSGRNSTNGFTRKIFKLKDGEQVYRILPAVGDLVDSNVWEVRYAVQWGYKTSDGKRKPFDSPERKNFKTKPPTITVSDAAKVRLDLLKAKLEEARESGNKAVFDKLSTLVGREGLYNMDVNYHMNAIDAQGNIGVLQLRGKCNSLLLALIKKMEANGTFPLSPEDGRYFVFTRTGTFNDTGFSVSVLQEEISVPGYKEKMKRDVVHTLTPEIINRLDREAGKLDQLFPRPTAEQVQRIVDSSDLYTGVSPYLDDLFSRTVPAAAASSEGADDLDDSQDDVPSDPAAFTGAAQAQAVVQAAVLPPTVTIPTVAQAAPRVSSAPAVVSKPAVSIDALSQEDFMNMLNNGTL